MSIKETLKKHWLIVFILLVGGSLRLYGLLKTPISLYSDEVDMGYQAYSLIKTGCDYSGFCLPVQFHSFSDVQPPLPIYSIAAAHIIGVPLDLSIRLTSAIFGLLGVLFTYLLVNKLFSKDLFDLGLPKSGVISAILLILVPWHFTYSRIGFSLAMLYFFLTAGLYLFVVYLGSKKNLFLYLSLLMLGLSPMVYNTAKMSILFYPFVLLLLPGAFDLFKRSLNFKIGLISMFIPLAIMFIGGGTTARFDYISVFSDPTAPTEINHQRLLDSGPMAGVGSTPSIATKLFHNKPVWFANNLLTNSFGLLSTDFLFTKGDPNLRHSPASSGMLYRSLAPALLLGIYFIIRFRHDRLLLVLGLLTLIAISTSAITRDGSSHASRSFMMLQPIIFICGIGLAYLLKIWKSIFYTLLVVIALEASFFIHDYWYHFRFDSAGSWSYGMKEIISSSQKYPGRPIVISPKNENPLIFYLYYTKYDPKSFQELVKSNTIYTSTEGKHNLDGNRVGNTDLYIATPIDINRKSEDSLPNAVYFLTKIETEASVIRSFSSKVDVIRLPSGIPVFYEIHL